MSARFFEGNKVEKLMMEVVLHHQSNNTVPAINALFHTLRLNSNVNHYKQIFTVY